DGDRPLLARGLFGQPVVAVVEHGEHIALVHELADVDQAPSHLAAHAEGVVDLEARLHVAGIAIGFTDGVVADLGGAHRPRRLDGRLVRGAGAEQGGNGQRDGRGMGVVQDSSSLYDWRFTNATRGWRRRRWVALGAVARRPARTP